VVRKWTTPQHLTAVSLSVRIIAHLTSTLEWKYVWFCQIYSRRFYCDAVQYGLRRRCLAVWPGLSRFLYPTAYERPFSVVSEKKNDWWRATPSTWNFSYSIVIYLFVKRACVLAFTSCYLNIGNDWRARLNGSVFRNVFCAVGYSDVTYMHAFRAYIFCQSLPMGTLQRGLSAIADLFV